MSALRLKLSRHWAAAAVICLLLMATILPAQATIVTVQLDDPTNDVPPGGGPNIVSIVTEYDGATNRITSITVNFSEPVEPPSSFAVDSMGGYILIDLGADADLAAELATFFALSPSVEYYVDLFFEDAIAQAPQIIVPLIDQMGNWVDLPIEYSNSNMTLRIDFSSASLSTVNGFAVGAIVGFFPPDGPTDQAPVSIVPEPASLAAWSLAALGLACAARKRRIRTLHPKTRL